MCTVSYNGATLSPGSMCQETHPVDDGKHVPIEVSNGHCPSPSCELNLEIGTLNQIQERKILIFSSVNLNITVLRGGIEGSTANH